MIDFNHFLPHFRILNILLRTSSTLHQYNTLDFTSISDPQLYTLDYENMENINFIHWNIQIFYIYLSSETHLKPISNIYQVKPISNPKFFKNEKSRFKIYFKIYENRVYKLGLYIQNLGLYIQLGLYIVYKLGLSMKQSVSNG